MKRSIIYILIGVLLLSVLLSGCSGGKTISDGIYAPEGEGNYEQLEFKDGEVTFWYEWLNGITNSVEIVSRTTKYTYKNETLTYEGPMGDSVTLPLKVIDDSTITVGAFKYIKQ